MSLLRSGIGLLLATSLSLASSSHAAADDVEEADALFDRAEVARAELRIAEARELLRRSLELAPRAPTAFNLAVLSAEMLLISDAIQLFTALLEGEYGRLGRAQKREVRARLEEARASLASLYISVTGPGRATLRVDAETVGRLRGGTPVELKVDPGRHVVAAVSVDGRIDERLIELGRGSRSKLAFALGPLFGGDQPSDRGSDRRLVSSPVFWLIALATTAAITGLSIGIAMSKRDPDRVVDPVLGDIATLRIP